MKLGCNNLFTHSHSSKYTLIFEFLAGFSLKHPETLRIPRQWVLNILKLSNEGRMPINNGPQTKLGYDNGFYFFHYIVIDVYFIWCLLVTLCLLIEYNYRMTTFLFYIGHLLHFLCLHHCWIILDSLTLCLPLNMSISNTLFSL